MHIHFEKTINATCDCTILSMSWMGKVPDELPEDEGWKLNRTHYYQEGWLATGNVRGVLGVTYTTSHWKKNPSEVPNRTNYNLRGHRSQITLVQWNEPYQKLASCDSSGIIFVWIKFEGRWSIELINDRNTPVTHFSWSHDGRMALICYQDNFVLVGSVAGQRYWSTLLNLDATITCGIWTPDDQQVYFGTSNGQVVVMDVHGVMLSQVQLPSDSPISSMAWSCEKFKMEESEDGEATSSSNHYCSKRPFLLAVCFKTGGIYLMKSYDDVAPIYISTGMHGLHKEWSNSGEFLAVAGSRPIEVLHENGNRVKEYSNSLHVYNHQGVRIVNISIPHVLSPVTSMTWGHNDKRIFIATGKLVHVGWVSKRIASLQLLCRLAIYKSLSTETCVSHLPLPLPVRALITSLHTQTIPSLLPNIKDLRDFVTHPPSGNLRLYCTMIRHDEDANQSPGTAYTLYLEYLGGLIPILKGKRTSKIRPEFVIYDPQATEERSFGLMIQHGSGGNGAERSSAGMVVACGADGGMGGGIGGCSSCHCCNLAHHPHHHHHVVHCHHNHQHSGQAGSSGAGDTSGSKSTCPGATSITNASSSTCTASTCSITSASNGNCGSSSTPSSNSAANGLAHSNMTHLHCHCCCHNHHHHHHVQQHPAAIMANNPSCSGSTIGSSAASLGFSDSSESEDVELCASPRMQRKRYRNRQRERERLLEREREREWERTRSSVHLMPEPAHPHQLVYNDVLPEAVRLVEVTSNIWGTKFKIHGVSPSVPDSLGQVTYKTSLLHLQPRQMTLLITELRDDIFYSPDNLLHGTYLYEDEEDLSIVLDPDSGSSAHLPNHHNGLNSAVIIQNVGGGGGGGGGVRGDVYTGANVIYHPQGVPRGEDSPPIISTSRCYLQSSSSASSSTAGTSQQQLASGSSSTLASSSMGASATASPYHSSSIRNPGPSSSSGASASTSCCSSSTHLQYYASSSTTTTTRSDSALAYDLDDQDEFPYVDLTANSEIIQFRETLRNSLNYESIQAASSASSSSGVISNCRSSLCQVCEPASTPVPQTPVKMATALGSGGGGGMNAEVAMDLADKAMQRVKYGLTRAQIERVGESDGSGVATSTPSPPRTSSRSLRSPKKVSGFGGSSQSRLSTPAHGHQVSSVAEPCQVQASSSLNQSHTLYQQQQQQMQPVPVTAPMFVRRSMSASYLDNVDRNVVVSLDVVGNEQAGNSPPKRLILVKKRGQQNGEGEPGSGPFSSGGSGGKPRLKDWGKSKSWDSCDLSGWKKGVSGASATLSASAYRREVSTSSCPKCRFPSTEPVRTCVTMAEPLLHCRAKVPMTPARRNMMTNCSTSRTLLAQQQKFSSSSAREQPQQASSSSGEDVIEIANEGSPPNATPTHVPPTSSTPPPPPPPVHRRSLSLLTPLLRRREMLNAARQQQSADASSSSSSKQRNNSGGNNGQGSSSSNNAPHSSSFIPPGSPQHQPRSSPSTPATQRRSKQSYLSSASSPFRQLFINSPLLTRRKNKSNSSTSTNGTSAASRNQRRRSFIDSSDEEGILEESSQQHSNSSNYQQTQNSNCCTMCGANEGAHCAHNNANATVPFASTTTSHTPFRSDCDALQRTQIHQKVGRKKIQCIEPCPMTPRRREFLMHNKAPMWNENSQVYQLDFGGRVTQESAKNFQIEFRGKQVMQFGRIDGSAYTLDFQYPFAAVQAFSVALANVTQRLK